MQRHRRKLRNEHGGVAWIGGMKTSRDRLGRFAPGNQYAVGNRGNRNPKWGNRNAVKHGFYERLTIFYVDTDGWLRIRALKGVPVRIRIPPDAYFVDEQGVHIRQDILDRLRELEC